MTYPHVVHRINLTLSAMRRLAGLGFVLYLEEPQGPIHARRLAIVIDSVFRVTLAAFDLVVVDEMLPAGVIAQCLVEAEALDARGLLEPPAMHRALGDRRDRLVGLNEGTDLLPTDSALVRPRRGAPTTLGGCDAAAP